MPDTWIAVTITSAIGTIVTTTFIRPGDLAPKAMRVNAAVPTAIITWPISAEPVCSRPRAVASIDGAGGAVERTIVPNVAARAAKYPRRTTVKNTGFQARAAVLLPSTVSGSRISGVGKANTVSTTSAVPAIAPRRPRAPAIVARAVASVSHPNSSSRGDQR